MTARSFLCLTAGAMAFATNAICGPPLLTDDPDTPGPNHWEINVALTSEKTGDGWRFETPLVDLNYGIGEHLELTYEVPFVMADGSNGHILGGLGNSLVGVKWRFLDQAQAWLDVSTYPQLEFNTESASADRGLADSGRSLLLPFELGHKFGPLTVYAELGHFWNQQRPNEWLYGIAAEYEVRETLSLMAELHGTAQDRFGEDQLVINLGSQWQFSEHAGLLMSVGRAIRSTGSGEPGFLSYVALQFTL